MEKRFVMFDTATTPADAYHIPQPRTAEVVAPAASPDTEAARALVAAAFAGTNAESLVNPDRAYDGMTTPEQPGQIDLGSDRIDTGLWGREPAAPAPDGSVQALANEATTQARRSAEYHEPWVPAEIACQQIAAAGVALTAERDAAARETANFGLAA